MIPQAFICTISSTGLHNWEICKSIQAWGVATNGLKVTLPDVTIGDLLFIYHASKGIIAICRISERIRIPTEREQTPWAGGLYRYGGLVPFILQEEFPEPISIKFENMRIKGTKISATSLRKGFSRIEKEDTAELQRIIEEFRREIF